MNLRGKLSDFCLAAGDSVEEGIMDFLLLRLPVKSLNRFRLLLVVGRYNYLLKSLNYEISNFEALKLDIDANDDSLRALDCPFRLRLGIRSSIIIWNPTTGEFKQIPPPTESISCNFSNLGFGYDAVSDDLKILAPKIYALKYKSWRSGSCKMYTVPDLRGVYLNGCFHWLRRSKEEGLGGSTCSVLSVDLSEEKFQLVFPLPDIDDKLYYTHLTVLGGCLFLYRRPCSGKFGSLTTMKDLLSLYSPDDNSYQLATFGNLQLYSAEMYVESLVSP